MDGTPYGRDIWVMDADGSNRRNLTNGVGWNGGATWSPDGSMIAFHSVRNPFTDIWSEGDYNIWVMDADGSTQRKLLDDYGWETWPAWSPDGATIAYEAGDFFTSIWLIDADGGNRRELTSEPGFGAGHATWSPDGRWIAYSRYEAKTEGIPSEIFRIRIEDGETQNLTNHPDVDTAPAWSPDGESIIFRSGRDGGAGLWVMNADGSGQRSLDAPNDLRSSRFHDWERIPTSRFDDVLESHVFAADVEWLAAAGVTKGCNPPFNSMFCPDDWVTRGQMAAFLDRALGLTGSLDDPFTDDDWSIFEDSIEKLAAAGITRGCNPPANDRFCPKDPVTREQMAAFLVRALGYTEGAGSDRFGDDDGSIFEADIERLAAAAGVTLGCNPSFNTSFCPKDPVTRGQMAAFLHRALG